MNRLKKKNNNKRNNKNTEINSSVLGPIQNSSLKKNCSVWDGLYSVLDLNFSCTSFVVSGKWVNLYGSSLWKGDTNIYHTGVLSRLNELQE